MGGATRRWPAASRGESEPRIRRPHHTEEEHVETRTTQLSPVGEVALS
jgi:hypothetical protein